MPKFYLKRLSHDRREASSKRVEMREEKKQLISIRTDCQTRWGLFENWGRVDGEGL